MRNLTIRERAIIVGALLTFIVGAGHRYWKAQRSVAATAPPGIEQSRDGED